MKTKLCLLAIASIFLSCMASTSYANGSGIIPAVKSGFYYQMNGGEDIPLPAFYDTSYIPLDVEGDIGLGFNCGAFNPLVSIRNSLNEIKHSAMNVKRQVLNDATAAVTEFPMYELSRSDPNLYNLITNAMAGANEDIRVSTKSCHVMQSEIANGQNPYADWGQVSLGNRWQQDIGSAELSGKGDINQARHDVSQNAGKSGIPWVNPNDTADLSSGQTTYAGGVHQPRIHVIRDTAIAGYGVIMNDGRSSAGNDTTMGRSQSTLAKAFPTAKDAAEWVINVVGDQIITTYNGGPKSSKPGIGLYADIQYQTQKLIPKIAHVVIEVPMSDKGAMRKALQAISPTGMAISPQAVEAIKGQSKVIQGILIDKLAQNIAAMQVINKARLAMQILQSGSRVPAIYANKAAQQNLQTAISQLHSDIQTILMFTKARQTLMSNMLSTVVQAGAAQEAHNTKILIKQPNAPIIKNGAASKHAN